MLSSSSGTGKPWGAFHPRSGGKACLSARSTHSSCSRMAAAKGPSGTGTPVISTLASVASMVLVMPSVYLNLSFMVVPWLAGTAEGGIFQLDPGEDAEVLAQQVHVVVAEVLVVQV